MASQEDVRNKNEDRNLKRIESEGGEKVMKGREYMKIQTKGKIF
jgi:hypothetical protein